MSTSMTALKRLRITSVSELEQTKDGGRYYFVVRFRQGLSKAVHRVFWSISSDLGEGFERLSPEEATALMEAGADLSGFASIKASEIEPEEWIDENGEVQTTRSRAVIQFADETLERALAAYGSRPCEGRETPSTEGIEGANPLVPARPGTARLNGQAAAV